MEEHIVSDEHPLALSLQRSREELRRVLLPRGPNPHRPPGEFPRSAVMRFLFNPRQRKLGVTLVSAALLLIRRRDGRGMANWLQRLRPLFGAAR
jgi:hypothetical protein